MSRRIKTLRPQELIRVLEKAGFTQKRQTGSHVILGREGMRAIRGQLTKRKKSYAKLLRRVLIPGSIPDRLCLGDTQTYAKK